MSRNRNILRQSAKLKTSLRLALIIGTASVTGFVILLLIVFNLTRQEVSKAGSPMMFLNAEVFQDTTAVLRGSMNRQVIGVMIETRGNGLPLKFNSIRFTLNGTTNPVSRQVENARLWFTGNQKQFAVKNLFAPTISTLNENEFVFDCNKNLEAGKNYFWLTVDIKSNAAPNSMLDASCLSLTVGATDYLPLLSSPSGNKRIRANTAYFSTGSADIMNTTAWSTKRDGSGSNPATMQEGNACYFIQSGHSIAANELSSFPMIVVEGGGKFVMDNSLRINEMSIAGNGVFQFNVPSNETISIGTMKVEDGGMYIHNSNGKYPAENSSFAENADALYYQYGQYSFPLNVSWGSVTIDARKSIHADITHVFETVKGDFVVLSSAGNALYTHGNNTINVKGNVELAGGIVECVRGDNSRLTLNIANDLVIKGGLFKDVESTKSDNASACVNISGNVILNSGEISFDNSSSGKSEINLTGKENKQVKWIQNDKMKVALCDINIKAEKELFMKGSRLGEISKNRTLTVESGAKLWCNNFPVTGTGRFLLMDKATLACGHIDGINSEDAKGIIQTSERIYSSGANYVYYSSCSPQQTGKISTTPVDGSMRNLIIRKELPGQQVLLSKNYLVTEQIKIGMGELNRGQFNVTTGEMSESLKTK